MLTIGSLPENVVDTNIGWVSIRKATHWVLPLTSPTIPDNDPLETKADAILDIGTSLIYGPKEKISHISGLLRLHDGVFPCLIRESLPNLTFQFNSTLIYLTSQQYIIIWGQSFTMSRNNIRTSLGSGSCFNAFPSIHYELIWLLRFPLWPTAQSRLTLAEACQVVYPPLWLSRHGGFIKCLLLGYSYISVIY